MKHLVKIFIAFLFTSSFLGCKYEDDFTNGTNETRVYFANQRQIRTIVATETAKTDIGIATGGMNKNNRDIKVKFRLAPELLSDTAYVPARFKYILLPSTHYSLPANLEVLIKSGTNVGSVPCVFNMDLIMKDSLAFTNTYILPFQITSSDADSILVSKPNETKSAGDKAFIVIKFVDKRHGNYIVKGTLTEIDTLTNAPIGSPVIYRKESLNENVRTLTTSKNNLLELNGVANIVASNPLDQINRSYIEFIGNALKYKTYKNSTVKISNSTVSYVEKSSTDKYFIMNYDFIKTQKKYKVTDTLVFRDFRNTAVLEW